MSRKYLYVFGYEDPDERRSNTEAGTDFESSAAVFIVAESAERALEWGREISERFIRLLYNDDSISWKDEGFAAWIEHDPEQFLRGSSYDRSEIPVVRWGDYPGL